MLKSSSNLCVILPLQVGLVPYPLIWQEQQKAASAETLTGICISFWGAVPVLRVLGVSQLVMHPDQVRGAIIPLSCSEVVISAL